MIPNSIDIFCEIIDNYGDIGVVYRFAKEMKRVYKDIEVRVILNRVDELLKINKKAVDIDFQEIDGITYIKEKELKKGLKKYGVSDIIVEAFGCEIFEEYIKLAKEKSKLWINLEYLSGEKWIEDFHLQTSLIDSVTLKKIFYMPGFSKNSGGIIIDEDFLKRKENGEKNREEILNKFFKDIDFKNKKVGSIFSYEKNFENLLEELRGREEEFVLLLMGEKTHESFDKLLEKKHIESFGNLIKYDKITLKKVEFLSQEEYEEVISVCDFNFTRGEDSIVRAILLGKPFLWHIYLQEEKAHMDKLNAFIDRFSESVEISVEERKIFDRYTNLLREYNDRDSNSLDETKEDYSVLFDNLDTINKICKLYSIFLTKECNLVKKLYKYIKEI